MKITKTEAKYLAQFVEGALTLGKTAKKIKTSKMGVYIKAYHYLKRTYVKV